MSAISLRSVLRYERCGLGVEVSLSQAAHFPPEGDDSPYQSSDKNSADRRSARVRWTSAFRAALGDKEIVDDSHKHLAGVLITAFSSIATMLTAAESGFQRFLIKPVNFSVLMPLVKQAVGSR